MTRHQGFGVFFVWCGIRAAQGEFTDWFCLRSSTFVGNYRPNGPIEMI